MSTLTPQETTSYRVLYNWGTSSYEIVEVISYEDKPYRYISADPISTHEDDSSLGEDEDPIVRLRAKLQAMLAACDQPVLKFPEDFAE